MSRLIAAAARDEPERADRQKRDGAGARDQAVAGGGARIALVDRPIGQAIEKHGGGARQDHADEHEQQTCARLGQPRAATKSAPSAKGSAKIVCEKRMSWRKRATAFPAAGGAGSAHRDYPCAIEERGQPVLALGHDRACRARRAFARNGSRAVCASDRRISFWFGQYLAGRKVKPAEPILIRASPRIRVPPSSAQCSASSPGRRALDGGHLEAGRHGAAPSWSRRRSPPANSALASGCA